MSPADVDAMAILRAKRKDCKGARWSENFSGLVHCRERCADVGSVVQGRVRRHASRAGTRAFGLIQAVLWPNRARGETELIGIGSPVTAQFCLPDQPVPHCVCSPVAGDPGHEQNKQGVWRRFYLGRSSNPSDGAGSLCLDVRRR